MGGINKMKIGFIGIGKLGKDAAEVMFDNGHNVIGYDVRTITESRFKITNSIKEVCEDREMIFVAVPTPHHPEYDGSKPTSHLEPKDFDYTIVKEVLTEINKYTTKNQLVVLISTVLPGTTRREFIPLVKNYRFIYNPYLIAMGTVKNDMINPEMIIIGTEDGKTNGDAKKLIEFYMTFVNKNVRVEVGTWDEAESIKIFYNTFISAKLSLVNMIQDVAEKNGNIDTDVVTGALEKSNYRITGKAYMKAGMGDGGPCHPRDNIALRYMANELNLGYDLFDSIMKSREIQAKNIAIKLVDMSIDYRLPIVIMGESYKIGVELYDGSFSRLVGYYLENEFSKKIKYDVIDEPSVFLLGHRHNFNILDFPEGSITLDPWRERHKENTIHYGKKKKTFNLVYNEWDESTNTPISNGLIYFNNNQFLISDGVSLLNHCNVQTGRNEFTTKKCRIDEVKRKPDENYYYVVNYHEPTSFIVDYVEEDGDEFILKSSENELINSEIKEMLRTCPNFYILLITEHEPTNEIEFIKILKYFELNNIPLSKVYCINNNSKLDEYKSKFESDINVYKINFLLYCKIRDLKDAGGCYFEPNKHGKFFLTFNKSLKPHRIALLNLLNNKNLLGDVNWSFVPTGNEKFDELFLKNVLDKDKIDFEFTKNLTYKLSDYERDIYTYDENNKDELSQTLTHFESFESYINSYVNITTESAFERQKNTIHISEKSFKPFFYYQFPIMVASQHHIKKMKELYDLDFFEDIVNHHYDDEPDHKKRLSMIVDEIERINNNKEIFIEFYRNNQDRFEKNKQKIINLLDFINKDYDFFKNLI
jgi:UDPglucose 6-dehydrogenase